MHTLSHACATLAAFPPLPFDFITGLGTSVTYIWNRSAQNWGLTASLAVIFIAALFAGARRWERPVGKATTVIASFLLLLLAAYVAFVLHEISLNR